MITRLITRAAEQRDPAPATAAPAGRPDVRLCFWVVPAFYGAFGIIFCLLTRVMPPPRPDITPEQIADFFDTHSLTIRIGFAVLMAVIGGAGVANGIVVYHMKRMTSGPVCAYIYMAGMSVGVLPGCLLVGFCFLVATLRPDRDPQLLVLLYDLGLLSFVGSLGCFTAAYFGFAVAIFYDRNNIFPKWLAYISIWQIVTELVAAPVFVMHAGPFAWNGSISFWTGVAVFGVWLSSVIAYLRRATRLEPVDAAPVA